MNVSQYLFAIQSLEGDTQGAKYKTLHSIASKIIENEMEKDDFLRTNFSLRIHPALLPHLRILVGIKLKSNEAVIEALRSDDVTIIKLALNAKWFFNGSNQLLKSEFFINNVIPHIALRTRVELIKTLANCLKNQPEKANEFFDKFTDLYGIEQTLPILVSCTEDHIYRVILKRKINLPVRILKSMYREKPKVVVRYLQLGNPGNKDNSNDRNIHSINLEDYVKFLPQLTRYHTCDFVELFECLTSYRRYNDLGKKRATYVVEKMPDAVIAKTCNLISILPMKYIYKKLSSKQFDQMFYNALDENIESYEMCRYLGYLKYYSGKDKFDFFQEKYKTKYGKDLLDSVDYSTLEEIVPADVKENYARKVLQEFKPKDSDYWDNVQNLPPKHAIAILKDKVEKEVGKAKSEYIRLMIGSCSRYGSYEDLFKVLEYFEKSHYENEGAEVLLDFLDTLSSKFEIEKLDESYWVYIKHMVQKAYAKGYLFTEYYGFRPEKFFRAALIYCLKKCEDNPIDEDANKFLETIVKIVLEYYCEKDVKWNFVVESPEFEVICLEMFLCTILQKYPESHVVWEKKKTKLSMSTYLLKTMNKINANKRKMNSRRRKKDKLVGFTDSKGQSIRFAIQDYPWLAKFALDLLKYEQEKMPYDVRVGYKEFRKILRIHDSYFYRSLMDANPELLYDVTNSDALKILKHDPIKILSSWEKYLTSCKARLQRKGGTTKTFVAATKWCKDIPIKFVDQCLQDIENKTSILILGILLDGESLSRIISPYLPKNPQLDIADAEAKKAYEIVSFIPSAINRTNPTISLDVLGSLCTNDYMSIVVKCIISVTRRVPVAKVIEFANRLIDKTVSVKKLGLRLLMMVTSNVEKQQFFLDKLNSESNTGVRDVLAKMVYDLFVQSPNEENWELMKSFIGGIKGSDENTLSKYLLLKPINKNFICEYFNAMLKKLEEIMKMNLVRRIRNIILIL